MSREAFEKWKKDKGVHYNAAQAWQAAWGEQQKRIDELKQEVKKWKAQSIMSVIHGTCDCGEPWQVVVSNKEGFNQLHCFACGKDRYENKDFFGEESALKGSEE